MKLCVSGRTFFYISAAGEAASSEKNKLTVTTGGTEEVSKVGFASEEVAWIYGQKEHKAGRLRDCC